MIVSRRPRAQLSPFIELLWASHPPFSAQGGFRRELVLPTGSVHIAIRLDDRPLRLFENLEDVSGSSASFAVVGGARAAAYIKDVSEPVPTVGALVRPGAVRLVTGVPAFEFCGAHTPLGDLWGSAASELRDRLGEVAFPHARLDLWEALLAARLPRVHGIHPAIAESISLLTRGAGVGTIVERIGYSHRHFINLFRDAVGLTPKLYGRVVRFSQVLDGLSIRPMASWADVAAEGGYADQPHFNRDFREFTGLSPERYGQLATRGDYHVSV